MTGIKTVRHASGFTLLEVLIAVALLAILMIGLLKITADNTQNLWYLENKTLASIVAANQAINLRLSGEIPEFIDGWETQSGRNWYWKVSRDAIRAMQDQVWRYQVDVFLEGDTAAYFSLETFIPTQQ